MAKIKDILIPLLLVWGAVQVVIMEVGKKKSLY